MKKFFCSVTAMLFIMALTAQKTDSWYKVLTGNIGNMPATMHLYKSGQKFGGYVWFAQNQWPMFLYYNVPLQPSDSTEMSAMSGPMSLQMNGILGDAGYAGKCILTKDGSASKSASFSLNNSNAAAFTPLQFYYVEGNAKFPPQYKNESVFKSFNGVVWPTGNTPYEAGIKRTVAQWIKLNAAAADPMAWMKAESDKEVNAWKKENLKLSPKEASEMGLSLSMELDNRIAVMYENDKNITLAKYNFAYTGGAHGLNTTTLINLDKKTGKTLQITDIVTPAGLNVLPIMLDRVARLQYGVKNNGPLTRNGFQVDRIPVSKNFYITSTGLGFLYAPYEIKSFADGEVNLLIPFAALNNWLQPAYKK